MATRVFTFDQGPPELAGIAGLLSPGRTLLLVPTAMLGAHYKRLAEVDSLVLANPSGNFLFQRAIKELLPDRPFNGSEERLVLRRTFHEVANKDTVFERRLRQDVTSWRDALADLEERGLTFPQDAPADVGAELRDRLTALQTEFRKQCKKEGRESFGRLARAYIAGPMLDDIDQVVMVGFTFFTPLQQALLDACEKRGVCVSLFRPAPTRTNKAYSIFENTYADLPSAVPGPTSPVEAVTGESLLALRDNLFDVACRPTRHGDPSVRTLAFHHRHNEVSQALRRVGELLDSGVKPRDIVVVVRERGQYERLIEEEVQRLGLTSGGEPLKLTVPPRLLLLTPAGRFILAMYEIYGPDGLNMPPETFERLLASGWLGSLLQDTAAHVGAVTPQWLNGATTAGQWRERLVLLRRYLGRDDRSPRSAASYIDEATIDQWENALVLIERMCSRLFTEGEASITQHVERLLDELSRLSPEEMRQTEREVLERIRNELESATAQSTMQVDARDFSDILLGMAQQREDLADEDDAKPDELRVTTPEGFDTMHRPYVFYLGLDDATVPRRFSDTWPIPSRKMSQHAPLERYLFYTVVTGCTKELWLSFAENDQEGAYGPSVYLREVCRILVRDAFERPDDLPVVRTLAKTRVDPKFPIRRDAYRLDEIAHFALCPYRYKLERLDPRAGAYRSSFQINFLAQGRWLELIFNGLPARGEIQGKDLSRELNKVAGTALVQLTAEFPGLTRRQLTQLKQAVRVQRDKLLEYQKGYTFEAEPDRRLEFTLRRPGTEETDIRVSFSMCGIYRDGLFIKWNNVGQLHREWLLPAIESRNAGAQSIQGVTVLATLKDAVQWWSRLGNGILAHAGATNLSEKRRFDAHRGQVTSWIDSLEAGEFPKNPGPHCSLCPAQKECLGRNAE
jgi:hypothetical protein